MVAPQNSFNFYETMIFRVFIQGIVEYLRSVGYIAFIFLTAFNAIAQPVAVTMVLETNKVAIGQSTILHVYAEIAPEEKPATLQIFSWYLDFLNENSSIANANYAALLRPTSDQDPRTSSGGFTVGANRRGIYDTFLNLPAAGHDDRVELFSVPVTGSAVGDATFTIARGTSVPDLSSDFLVAAEGGGDPLFGGNYSAASTTLQVVNSALVPATIHISATPLAAGQMRVTVTFPTQPNANQFVESTDALSPTATWVTLPGAPHNSGSVAETNSVPERFYRLRTTGV
jgi:hypothetical protein